MTKGWGKKRGKGRGNKAGNGIDGKRREEKGAGEGREGNRRESKGHNSPTDQIRLNL